jgi:hypothetical protein
MVMRCLQCKSRITFATKADTFAAAVAGFCTTKAKLGVDGENRILMPAVAPERVRLVVANVRVLRAVDGHDS